MNKANAMIVANAIIWAGVILAMNWLLQGTPFMSSTILVIGSGAAASIVIVGAGLREMARK